VEIYSFDRALISGLAARLERRMSLAISISDRHILLAMDDTTMEGGVMSHRLP
jgi:uncharacterized protein YaeQ